FRFPATSQSISAFSIFAAMDIGIFEAPGLLLRYSSASNIALSYPSFRTRYLCKSSVISIPSSLHNDKNELEAFSKIHSRFVEMPGERCCSASKHEGAEPVSS